MNRKKFIMNSIAGLTTLSFAPQILAQEKRPLALKPDLVRNFVRSGHFDFEAVKQMLNEKPTLINACWDWGGGDFETALGGAAHMGERKIAQFLISKGARMDIFAAAMLGEISLLKTFITAYPNLLHAKGPHSITLLMHAQKGGEKSKNAAKYLIKMGVKK